MAQWGKTDTTGDSVLWGVSQLEQTANTVNRDALYNNTTADQYFTGATHSQKAFDTTETAVAGAGVAHSGWVLETIGSGGRAGRVHREVLVAMGSITSDGSDLALVFLNEPSNDTIANTTVPSDYDNVFGIVTFDSNPAGASITAVWEYSPDNGTTPWVTVASIGAGHTNVTYTETITASSAALRISTANVTGEINPPATGYFRVKLTAAGSTDTFSRSAQLTMTA